MKPRGLLWLTLVVVAMFLFIYFFERDIPSTDEREDQADKVLLFEADEVARLSWTWDEHEVELVREIGDDEDSWRLTEPFQSRADDVAVDTLLDQLLGWKQESRIEGADRSEIGLVQPRAELRLETSRDAVVVRFGAALPVGQAMVVEVEGDDPVVVSEAIWSDLAKQPGDWRSKKILQTSRDAIRKVRLERGASVVQLVSRDESYWLEEPLSDLADRNLVRNLFDSLAGLGAISFVDDPTILVEAGLEPPVATLEVVLEDRDDPFVIELGFEVVESENEIYARAESQVFITAGDLLEAIHRPAEGWRSLALTTLDRWQIESIEVEDGSDPLFVSKAGVDWQRDGVAIDYPAIEELLGWLTETRAQALSDVERFESRPMIVCTLRDRDGREERLSFFETSDGDMVGNSRRSAWLSLPTDALGEFASKIASLRSAEARPKTDDSESP